jgi:hypothetical protein
MFGNKLANDGGSEMHQVIQSQYLASLEMLRQAIVRCPASLWADAAYKNPFWHLAYHALFYTHLYAQPSQEHFVQWAKHREQYEFLGALPWPPHDEPDIGEPYSKDEVLEYYELCQQQVIERVALLDLDAAESGFFWLPMGKMELQFYNIRHLQHHTGQLCERLRTAEGIGIDWVSMKG